LNFFSLGVTGEALRANIGSKSAISQQRGPVNQKFQVEGIAFASPRIAIRHVPVTFRSRSVI